MLYDHYDEVYLEDDLAFSDDFPTGDYGPDIDEFVDSNDVTPMKYLNSKDYSLNSPLIKDELEDFLYYWETGHISIRWDQDLFDRRKHAFSTVATRASISHPDNMHSRMASFMLSTTSNTTKICELLEATDSAAEETSPVVVSFLKGWINKEILYKKREHFLPGVLHWGELFLETYWMVLCLNCASPSEAQNLEEAGEFNFKALSGNTMSCVGELDTFGTFVTCENFIYLKKLGLLLDRNCLLMYKDLFAARFQTLLSMVPRYDGKFDEKDVEAMLYIYQLGDEIIQDGGNDAYNAIKLVEPICNLMQQNFVKPFRPLIPDFPSFGEHVHSSVIAASADHPKIVHLFNRIQEIGKLELILTVYGSFRHWGHPFINYMEGLSALYDQVQVVKDNVDNEYANCLASDLARLVLETKFREKKRWFVNVEEVPDENLLHPFIQANIWPTNDVIHAFGDQWHKLPLIACFDIPDLIDPSIIYSDKSHSMTRSEIISWIESNPGQRIPSKKVLVTLLERPSRDWKEFLRQVSENGIPLEMLVIGLKAKEREIKIKGRFFSLMSWDLRDYFVVTEYLIKEHFVPLFQGLTMADDLTTVMKKMMNNTSGQGASSYERVTIANHLDYTKWNNHQRKESTDPVFIVMGKFLGYPMLIAQTHRFFEQSWIYYNDRGDLLRQVDLNNCTAAENRVFWNGQLGGLEGLRQKGWSILNLLAIRRVSQMYSTRIKTLAQGDNQVICTHYKIDKYREDSDLVNHLNKVKRNNQEILDQIILGAEKLGLIINYDETMQSADFLNYGKIPVVRGNIRGLETKRWSRVTCTDNDQLPTLSNIMSSVASNALTVSHYSPSPINSMFHYNYLGNFVHLLLSEHNPALRGPTVKFLKQSNIIYGRDFRIGLIYLDPCMGGICGMSLTRFLMRMFPDPVTESLAFLKCVHQNTDDLDLKDLMCKLGNPFIKDYERDDFKRLVEDPLSLNIPRGLSSKTMIQLQIKDHLHSTAHLIGNKEIRHAVEHQSSQDDAMFSFLETIDPLFPRFLTMYRDATFSAIADSIVGLFQNSRTIRRQFSDRLGEELDSCIIKSELASHASIIRQINKISDPMWDCSASHADHLREKSWGRKTHGATIPHPLEMLGKIEHMNPSCQTCRTEGEERLYVSVMVPNGLVDYEFYRGPHPAYLGSKTSRYTKAVNPWESTTTIPLIRKAEILRDSIGWFVDPAGHLAQSILGNLKALTGVDWEGGLQLFLRTGSALHRADCSRQSAGGFSAQSPMKLNYIITTTSTLEEIHDTNYDFMFQTALLFGQMSVGEIHDGDPHNGRYHLHLNCRSCLRPIDEIVLESAYTHDHPDVSSILNQWKPESVSWKTDIPLIKLPEGAWQLVPDKEKSFYVGLAESFKFGLSHLLEGNISGNLGLFSQSVGMAVHPHEYCIGLLEGVIRISAVEVVYRRSVSEIRKPEAALYGTIWGMIDSLTKDPNLLNIWRNPNFISTFVTIPHKTPPSYPLHNHDLACLGVNYLQHHFLHRGLRLMERMIKRPVSMWMFSEMRNIQDIVFSAASLDIVEALRSGGITKGKKDCIHTSKCIMQEVLNNPEKFCLSKLPKGVAQLKATKSEIRHAVKAIVDSSSSKDFRTQLLLSIQEPWGKELEVLTTNVKIEFTSRFHKQDLPYKSSMVPLISGLRTHQQATGSHYKIRAILAGLDLHPRLCLSGGDGSGGITSALLRMYPNSFCVFNSLLIYDGVTLKGTNPSPPSALLAVPSVKNRCLNLLDVWTKPDDLANPDTWEYFASFLSGQTNSVEERYDIMVFDMEVRNPAEMSAIEDNVARWVSRLLSIDGVLIFKTYLWNLLGDRNIITKVGNQFQSVRTYWTEVTSSHSSEIYVVFSGIRDRVRELRYICPESIKQIILASYVNHSDDSEFRRALGLKKYDMMVGVPSSYRIDPLIHLIKCFQSVGVYPGQAQVLADFALSQVETDTVKDIPWVLYFLVGYLIVPICTPHECSPRPPSNGRVKSLGCWMVGFMLWVSWTLSDFVLYQQAKRILDNTFPFLFYERRTKSIYGSWKLGGKNGIKKYLYLDDQSSKIGQIIRVLSLCFPKDLSPPNFKRVFNIVEDMNAGARGKNIIQYTGLTQFLQGSFNDYKSEDIYEVNDKRDEESEEVLHAFQEF